MTLSVASSLLPEQTALLHTLKQIVGADNVLDDAAARVFFSQDIWRRAGHTVALVVRPGATDEAAAAVAAITAAGFSIAPRGGGMSYTSGYTPSNNSTVSIDLSRMARILDVNAADMTVTVEAGCTWKALHDALKPRGLRTPFWGPMSGVVSTIGGGVSQQNAMFGAGQHGTTSESVVGLVVVSANGTVLRTGVRAGTANPFYRFYGPDLTGLFCGDCGALGLKTEITLRLMRARAHEGYLSFAFKTAPDLFAAMAEIARAGLAAETCAFDPNLVRIRMKRASLGADLKTLGSVVGAEKSLMKGVASAARIALAGRDFIEQGDFPLHMICEARSAAALDADMAQARQIASNSNGHEIENTIAKIIRADPFPPPNTVLGPNGERWTPVHGYTSLSKAPLLFDALELMLESRRAEFEREGIVHAFLFTSFSTNAICIEPVFYWPSHREALHEATMEPAQLSRMPTYDANPAADALVEKARNEAISIFERFGCGHLQIGRTYPYRESLDNNARGLIDSIKFHLDPKGSFNPGGLGFPDVPRK